MMVFSSRRASSGFTFFDVIAALSIFGIGSTIIYATQARLFQQAVRSYNLWQVLVTIKNDRSEKDLADDAKHIAKRRKTPEQLKKEKEERKQKKAEQAKNAEKGETTAPETTMTGPAVEQRSASPKKEEKTFEFPPMKVTIEVAPPKEGSSLHEYTRLGETRCEAVVETTMGQFPMTYVRFTLLPAPKNLDKEEPAAQPGASGRQPPTASRGVR